jgi:hypothetical protein
VLEEVGLIGMRHVVGGGHSGIHVDEVVFSAWPAALDVSSPRPAGIYLKSPGAKCEGNRVNSRFLGAKINSYTAVH